MPSPIFPFNTGVAIGTGAESTLGSANANSVFGTENANNVIVQAGATAAGVAADYSSEIGPYAIGANLAGVVTGVQQYSDYANDPNATTSELVGTGFEILGNLIAVAGGAAEFAGLEGPGLAFQVAGDLVATAGADLVIYDRPDTESTYIPGFTDTNSTPPLTDAQLAQVASQLATMQPTTMPTTPASTGADTTNTTTPAATTPAAPTDTITPPDNATTSASTDTGTTNNTGPIAPTSDGSDDTGAAGSTVTIDVPADDSGTATAPAAAIGADDTSGSDVPSAIPAYVAPASAPQSPIGRLPDGTYIPGYGPDGPTATDPTITQSGATISSDSSEFYNVTGNNLSENIGVTNTSPIFINGDNDSLNLSAATSSFAVTDNGQGSTFDLSGIMPTAGSVITINDFQLDPTGLITLPSQYATASAAMAALQSDNQGGSILPLGNGASLHFVGDPSLTAASFAVGHA